MVLAGDFASYDVNAINDKAKNKKSEKVKFRIRKNKTFGDDKELVNKLKRMKNERETKKKIEERGTTNGEEYQSW